jgi:hypothetical protein
VLGESIDREEGEVSSSGVTLRSQEIVRIALANFNDLILRAEIRFVAISCIAFSACAETDDTN